MIVSHRVLRYAAPFLHVLAALSGGRLTRAAHAALLAAAFAGRAGDARS